MKRFDRVYLVTVVLLALLGIVSACFLPEADDIYPEDADGPGPDDDDSAEETA